MAEWAWRVLAWVVSRPLVADYLIRRSFRTPYSPIVSAENPDEVYMRRWWLFNPYDGHDAGGTYKARHSWCPISIRVHHIFVPDRDRHLHDHPWNARTIILMGGYVEERERAVWHLREAGDTAALKFGEYHRIRKVDPKQGAVTLFITGRYRGTWGFLVNGEKVPYKTYLGSK